MVWPKATLCYDSEPNRMNTRKLIGGLERERTLTRKIDHKQHINKLKWVSYRFTCLLLYSNFCCVGSVSLFWLWHMWTFENICSNFIWILYAIYVSTNNLRNDATIHTERIRLRMRRKGKMVQLPVVGYTAAVYANATCNEYWPAKWFEWCAKTETKSFDGDWGPAKNLHDIWSNSQLMRISQSKIALSFLMTEPDEIEWDSSLESRVSGRTTLLLTRNK